MKRKLEKVYPDLPQFVDESAEYRTMKRSGHRMVANGYNIYIIGGYNPVRANPLFKEVWEYNSITGQMCLLNCETESFPEEMASFAACMSEETPLRKLYTFGGTRFPFGLLVSSDVNEFIYSSKEKILKCKVLKVVGDLPQPLYGAALTYCDGAFYLIGGTDGFAFNMEVRSLRLENFEEDDQKQEFWRWKLLDDGKTYKGRYRHEIIVKDTDIIVIGGGNREWASTLRALLIFDTKAVKYRVQPIAPDPVNNFPKKRLCHTCIKYDDKAYIMGGCCSLLAQNPPDRSELLADIWQLDLINWQWKRLKIELNFPVCFHAASVTEDGCIYVFGGTIGIGESGRSSLMQRFWIQPPRLFFLAAQCFISNNQQYISCFQNFSAPMAIIDLMKTIFARPKFQCSNYSIK